MPKGYVISRVDVTNPEAYARYAAAATKAIADHGGKALARGGRSEALEGKARARNVVLEFESYEAARRYFYSEQYQAARGCVKAPRRSKWFWSRESERWPRVIGSSMSMCAIPRLTSSTSRPMRPPSPNTARASSCAAGRTSSRQAHARARNVVIEFRDYATALACHDSEEYREAAKLRDAASVADLVIVEGYEGPQPG